MKFLSDLIEEIKPSKMKKMAETYLSSLTEDADTLSEQRTAESKICILLFQ
jgi:hypothetical protein